MYRSTITENGLLALADGACRLTLTHVVLSLNTHANVPNFCISALLKNAPKLQVLELGGSKNTKSLYFQGNPYEINSYSIKSASCFVKTRK